MVEDSAAERLKRIRIICEKPQVTVSDSSAGAEALLRQSVEYLLSDQAMGSLERDPYWPKWDSPWWHMLLLWELGLVEQIPKTSIEAMVSALDSHYVKFFPFTEAEVPAGVDPIRNILCHCGLGSMFQLLTASGVDVDGRLPFMRQWILRYQMQDGGLNCDEAAYVREKKNGSVVSTVPPMEALLNCTPRPFTRNEEAFLNAGARYLIERKLARSVGSGQLIKAEWQQLIFPRFYEYDVLRGLSLLTNWALKLHRPLSPDAIGETVELIDRKFPDGRIESERTIWSGVGSRIYDEATGEWIKGAAGSYELLRFVGAPNQVSSKLSHTWKQTKKRLVSLLDSNLISQ